MLFTSPAFFALFALTFTIYYIPPLRRQQVTILIGASLIFYAWSAPWLLLLLIFSILVNSLASYQVAWSTTGRARLLWAAGGVAINLATLVLFKYGALVGGLFLGGAGAAGADGLLFMLLHLPLPIGISFYTFEGISLVVDTLRQEDRLRRGEPRQGWAIERSFGQHVSRTAFFVAFFPHLIAGPVLKAKSFFPQIGQKRLQDIRWEQAARALIVGYFLKVVVADNLQDQTFWLTYPYYQTQCTLTNLALLFGYSIQIFADFAGYSLIAIGLARLLGYELMQNFHFPYISRSLSEFWRRWHVSLSTWLRDYLYIPLGGSRHGELRTYLNLFIVMAVGGLWHGSTWSYAIWGMFHGLGLAAERLLRLDREPATAGAPLWRRLAVDSVRVLFVFGFVTSGWVFFKLPDFAQALDFFATLARNASMAPNLSRVVPVLIYTLPVILYHAPHFPTFQALGGRMAPAPARQSLLRQVALGLMLALLVLNPGSAEAFIYFQF